MDVVDRKVNRRWLAVSCLALLVTACGGGGGGGDNAVLSINNGTAGVSGGGVKGPLTNATVRAYVLNTNATGFFDRAAPVASGSTDAQAAIQGLNLPLPLTPPYILEFTSDATTRDLTTGQAPVIQTLRTVLSTDALTAIQAGTEKAYATPLTTLATDLAIRLSSAGDSSAQFLTNLTTARQRVANTLGFGLLRDTDGNEIDIFRVSPVINAQVDTANEQREASRYRMAVEAISGRAALLGQQAGLAQADDVLGELVGDLSDGTIDGIDNGQPNTLVTTARLNDPADGLFVNAAAIAATPIPGTTTNQTVGDTLIILRNEISDIGETDNTNNLASVNNADVTPSQASSDEDADDDGVNNINDAFPQDSSETVDTDGDGSGNNADTDDDNDNVPDANDAFPLDPNESVDTDNDGTGNNADTDDDNDNTPDANDAFPLDPNESLDTDNDGTGNNADTDDDNDNVLDANDAFPLDPNESVDTDNDGTGNNADTDDDNDNVLDANDAFPLDPNESVDTDNDGIGNNADTDDDGDGTPDASDAFPLDPAETIDTDNDGIGNNGDIDDDGDGTPDSNDAFPLDPNESVDTDGDGIGDNADTDDDGDGVPDVNDNAHIVSGTVTSASNAAVDSDVNETNTPATSNNTVATAQDIPNPVILGGYANAPGGGPAGRSQLAGDTLDIFRISLAQGQSVVLEIASTTPAADDLDLILASSAGTVIKTSRTSNRTESLTVDSSGTFLVMVEARSGGTNYTLRVSQSLASGAGSVAMTSDADFVVDEVWMQMKQADVQANTASVASMAGLMGMSKAGGDWERSMLWRRDTPVAAALSSDWVAAGLSYESTDLAAKDQTLLDVKRMGKVAGVDWASPNYQAQASRVPNDSLFVRQWHYNQIQLPQAWDTTIGLSSVIVAVVDTGVLLSHPDFSGQLVSGFDFISSVQTSLDGDGIDANPDDPGESGPSGGGFHGSHVAGTVAARTDNGSGVAGAGWQARIMPIRVLGRGGAGSFFDITQGIRFAAGLSNDSNTVPAQRADVINLSLGGSAVPSGLQSVIDQVRAQGVIVIAAAGNSSTSAPSFPAALDGVVSVSAVDINRNQAFYSNFGNTIDVAAPGGDVTKDLDGNGIPDGVLSTLGQLNNGNVDFGFGVLMGTSMAAPHVAGVAALMKAVHPGLTPAEFDSALAAGSLTDDLGATGRDDTFGQGLINARKAVEAATQLAGGNVPVADPVAVVNPTSLNFGQTTTTLDFIVSNGGGDGLQIAAVTDNAAFLTVAALQVDANGLGTYRATVDRSGLADGTFSATITVDSNQNDLSVPVIMQVSSQPLAANSGRQFILLIDPETQNVVDQRVVDAVNGQYSYSFTGVATGQYQLFSGSDHNNDGFICDTAESCGSFSTLENPVTITINSDRADVNFATGFSSNTGTAGVTEADESAGGIRRLEAQKELQP